MFTEWVNPEDHRKGFNIGKSVTIRNFDDATINQVDSI
jgi:hypothetical protein